MLTCDICKKNIEGNRDYLKPEFLPYVYACRSYQHKHFDLCNECRSVLRNIVEQAKMAFVNGEYFPGVGFVYRGEGKFVSIDELPGGDTQEEK